jgi:hypothetical protein
MWPASRAGSQISCVALSSIVSHDPTFLPAGVGIMVQQSVRRHLGNGSAFDRDQNPAEIDGIFIPFRDGDHGGMPDETKRAAGPAIYAVDPWVPGKPRVRHQLLSDDERALLARIASIVRFNKEEHIYHDGDAADALFQRHKRGRHYLPRACGGRTRHVISLPGRSVRPLRGGTLFERGKSRYVGRRLQNSPTRIAPYLK